MQSLARWGGGVARDGASGVRARRVSRSAAACSVEVGPAKQAKQALAASALAAALTVGGGPAVVGPALADEFTVLNAPAPAKHVYDDAGVLSITTKKEIAKEVESIISETGVTLDVVTVRKLTVDPDPYSFSETVLNKWHSSDKDSSGVLLMVSSSNEGAVSAGKAFQSKVDGIVVDGIEANNIPIYCEDEKYNEAILSSVKRISAVAKGQADPGNPERAMKAQEQNFKNYEDTENKRDKYIFVVGGLLVIAFVVPMIQFWGYTS